MLRHLTKEEKELIAKLENPNITKEERERLRNRLSEINNKECGDTPFCH